MDLDERAHELLKRFDQIQSKNQIELGNYQDRIYSKIENLAVQIDSQSQSNEQSTVILMEFVIKEIKFRPTASIVVLKRF